MTSLSLSPSPLLRWQQHLCLMYVTLPRLLCQPGSTVRVWHHFLCRRVPVRGRFRHEWGNLCAILTVWLHLPRQILPCKSFLEQFEPSLCLPLCDNAASFHPSSPLSPSTLQLKEKFVTEDCSQSCECTSNGAVCQLNTCSNNYVCTIYDFKRDCFRGCVWSFFL